MHIIQRVAIAGSALSLAACTTTPTGPVTDLPDRVEYSRRITISYAAAEAANAERCAPIDRAVLQTRQGNDLYNSPGVVHSAVDNAADAFINQQHIICRMSAYNSEEMLRGALLIAEFRPVADGSGYLRIGHERNTGPGMAFWIAAEGAATLAEETGNAPWQDAFECRQPYNFTDAGGGRYEMVTGDIRCLPVLTHRLEIEPPPPPIGRDGLRGLQQPNRTEDLISQ